MNADNEKLKHHALTDQIIKAFYAVYNVLGYGFLERVYVNALLVELEKMEISAQLQQAIHVLYDGKLVGEYFADIVVEEKVIIEVEAAKTMCIRANPRPILTRCFIKLFSPSTFFHLRLTKGYQP